MLTLVFCKPLIVTFGFKLSRISLPDPFPAMKGRNLLSGLLSYNTQDYLPRDETDSQWAAPFHTNH